MWNIKHKLLKREQEQSGSKFLSILLFLLSTFLNWLLDTFTMKAHQAAVLYQDYRRKEESLSKNVKRRVR